MKISSPNFENKGQIPEKYTCEGNNVSPELKIENVPSNVESFALIMEDPDAPNGTWDHWVVWNIPPQTTVIPENSSLDFAVQGANSWGKIGYGGPCPPTGTHRYFFKLYALAKTLELPEKSTKQELLKEIEEEIIDLAQLMGTYKKHN